MNKNEFLDILEKNLDKLPADEKSDAMNYYRELFEDAGTENEQKIIENLGDPKDVSRQILIENGISPDYEPEFLPEKSTGYSNNENFESTGTTDGMDSTGSTENINDTGIKYSSDKDNSQLLLIIIILAVTSPAWLGAIFSVLGTAIGIIAAVFAIGIALYAVSGALIIGGFAALFYAVPMGMVLMGTGSIMFGISLLVVKPAFKGTIKLLTWIVNKIVELVKNLAGKWR